MNAGLPGTGLGGLFYLIGALWMPVSALSGRIRGRRTAWRVVARQSGIALGVFAALWLTGWGVGYLIALGAEAPVGGAGRGGAPAAVTNVIHWVAVLGTAGLLAVIIALVQILRLVVPRPIAGPAAARATEPGVLDLPAVDDRPTPRAKGRRVA
jgi:hypothetical protein